MNLFQSQTKFNLETAVGSQKSAQALGEKKKKKNVVSPQRCPRMFLFHHAPQNLTRTFVIQRLSLGLKPLIGYSGTSTVPW